MAAGTVDHGALSGAWRMDQVLQEFPSAQRALSEKYRIDRLGDANGAGYQPADTLAAVAMSRRVNVSEAIEHIRTTQDIAKDVEITVRDTADLLKQGSVKLLDVRSPPAFAMASVPGSVILDQTLAQDIVENWPKETPIILVCHHGMRSLDAALYMRSHGFGNVKSLSGGVDAWSLEIDPSVPRY